MQIKEQLAIEYSNQFDFAEDSSPYTDFLAGYNVAIEKVKEYLFNTEEHQDKDDVFYISEEYLKQTIKFLNEQ